MNQVTNMLQNKYVKSLCEGSANFVGSSKRLISHPNEIGTLVSRTYSAALKVLEKIVKSIPTGSGINHFFCEAKKNVQIIFSLQNPFLTRSQDVVANVWHCFRPA